MAERQDVEKIQGAKPWDKVLAPLMALSLGFPPVIVAGLDHRHGWSPEFPPWLVALGFVLIALGYAFATWALAENRFFCSVVRIQTDRGHAVCDSGPYRIVRHPGYAGNVLALLGIVLAFYHRRDLMSHDDASADTRAAFAALLAASRRGSPDAAVAIDGASKA